MVEHLHDNNHMWYDHIQGNKLIVTYDTNLNLKEFICQNKARPNLTFKLM